MRNEWLITDEILIEAQREIMNSSKPVVRMMYDGSIRISELADAVEIKTEK